jgi:hypothetical protein
MLTARSTFPLVPLVAALACAAPACSKPSSGAIDAATISPAASIAAAKPASSSDKVSGAEAAVATGPCKVDVAPFVIDKSARGETGVALVRLPDDRFAVGYAGPDGTPRAAVILPEGSASVVDVDASQLPLLAQKPPPKAQRFVHRVTPLAAKGLSMRVAVDVTETHGDGSRIVRCGPADEEALLHFEGPSAYGGADSGVAGQSPELRDCRSFTARGSVWALGFEADTSGTVEARWVVKPDGTKLDPERSAIEHAVVPLEQGHPLPRAAQLDRYGYTVLGSAKLEDAGYLVASRYNGKLRIAKRDKEWAPVGKVTDYWFGTATGMPALVARGTKVVVLTPITGKLDLYGSTFPIEAEAKKPEKIELADPPGGGPAPPDAERTSVTAAIASRGQVAVAYLDGKTGKRRPRVALLDEALKSEGATLDPFGPGDADVADIKMVMLPDERVLVTALVAGPGGGLQVEGAVLGCGLPPMASDTTAKDH